MNIDNFFYLNNYNSNFIEDFSTYLKDETIFNINTLDKTSNGYTFYLNCVIDNDNANKIFDVNINELTLDRMNNICLNNFNNLILLRKLTQKIINESEYEVSFTSAKFSFHYDIINRIPHIEINFKLELTK